MAQANELLFSAGPQDCPATIVFSPDPVFDVVPDRLEDMAREIYALRETPPKHPDLTPIAALMNDEYARFSGRALPPRLARDRCVYLGVTMIHRTQLPTRRLSTKILPLLVHPSTPWALPLPAALWEGDLVEAWRDLGAEGA